MMASDNTHDTRVPHLVVAARDDAARLDRFLKKRFPLLPHGLVHKLARNRGVTVNRKRAQANARLQAGDTVEVRTDLSRFERTTDHVLHKAERSRTTGAFRRHFRLLFEDDALIVLDKPAGLVVHPDRHHRRGDTLLDLLKAYVPLAFAPDEDFHPAFVHRLDRGTSGVIVAARTRAVARILERTFRTRQVSKTYRALVVGRLKSKRGTIDAAIEKHTTPSGVTRFAARSSTVDEDESGSASRTAVTRYRRLEEYRRASLLEVELGTGRTHQIRVHFKAMGTPIVGDGDYGNKQVNRYYRQRFGLGRLFLHAAELHLPHPTTGNVVSFRAPLPRDLHKVLDGLMAGPG